MKQLLSKNWIIITFLFAAILGAYCSVFFLGKNNPIEIEIEKLIDVETGVKIDLTP